MEEREEERCCYRLSHSLTVAAAAAAATARSLAVTTGGAVTVVATALAIAVGVSEPDEKGDVLPLLLSSCLRRGRLQQQQQQHYCHHLLPSPLLCSHLLLAVQRGVVGSLVVCRDSDSPAACTGTGSHDGVDNENNVVIIVVVIYSSHCCPAHTHC